MTMPFRDRALKILLLAALGLVVSAFLRRRLYTERDTLELAPSVLKTETTGARGVLAERQVAILSAGLGVVRPLAIDFLWLRTIHLQERGEYFEVASLSSLITGLAPRLPEVWTFQARNLAYNVPPGFPPSERFPWILKGVELLRDDALLYNPSHPSIHLDLALLFLHKIGLDHDDAGPLYRAQLAAMFDVNPESAVGLERRRDWKLDRDLVGRIEERVKAPLDFRVSASHALYWAWKGLEQSPGLAGWFRKRLEEAQVGALFQLLGSGRPVKAPEGVGFAFLPEPRFQEATQMAIQSSAAIYPGDELSEALSSLARISVIARIIWVGEPEAREQFTRESSHLGAFAATLDDLVLRWALGESARTPERAIADLLDAALLLETAREPVPAEGFKRLASIVWRRSTSAGGAGAASSLEVQLGRATWRAQTLSVLEDLPFRLEQIAPSSRRPQAP